MMRRMGCGDDRNIIYRRLHTVREQAGMSRSEPAAKVQVEGVNLDQQSISRIERNLRTVTDCELKAIRDVLHIDPGALPET